MALQRGDIAFRPNDFDVSFDPFTAFGDAKPKRRHGQRELEVVPSKYQLGDSSSTIQQAVCRTFRRTFITVTRKLFSSR